MDGHSSSGCGPYPRRKGCRVIHQDLHKDGFKSGFVAIVGAPNVGKSTLLNQLLGEKISITSKKPQTTRNRILGILHREKSQIVFMDTPGVHKATGTLNHRIVDAAMAALDEVDLILMMVDASNPDSTSEQILIKALKNLNKPVILGLNKIDLLAKSGLLLLMEQWEKAYPFQEIIPFSAKTGDQTDVLMTSMESILPEGPPFFPPDSLTDASERFIVSELIREKAFRLTGQEIPYSIAVTIDKFSENPRIINIHATLHVERDSQKGIVIGKGGSKLKQIGESARKDIEKLLGTKIFLKLFVRVQKNWTRDTKALRKFGY